MSVCVSRYYKTVGSVRKIMSWMIDFFLCTQARWKMPSIKVIAFDPANDRLKCRHLSVCFYRRMNEKINYFIEPFFFLSPSFRLIFGAIKIRSDFITRSMVERDKMSFTLFMFSFGLEMDQPSRSKSLRVLTFWLI